MNTRFYTLIAIASSVLVTGCTSQPSIESRVDELTTQLDTLYYQVSALQKVAIESRDNVNMDAQFQSQISEIQGEITTIFASSALAYDEAVRANSRIDNMAQSYTK